MELGSEALATGHYVRRTCDPDGTCHLRMARNIAKDQSYFLYTLTQERLARIVFPLGEIGSKDEVRRLAREFGLTVAEKSDSQEVCFIPGDDYVAFLEGSGMAQSCGEIVHLNGTLLGRHDGTHRYTVGQRKGLGIAWSEPLYVVEIDPATSRVVVAEQQHLFAAGLLATDVSWVVRPAEQEIDCSCKIRYRHQPVACRVLVRDGGNCEVRFAEAQRSVSPGQSVVFYRGDEVLGGARIVSALPALPN